MAKFSELLWTPEGRDKIATFIGVTGVIGGAVVSAILIAAIYLGY